MGEAHVDSLKPSFGLKKARGCAPSRLQRNLVPDDIVLHLTKVQPS
jgi:hypothetical protein